MRIQEEDASEFLKSILGNGGAQRSNLLKPKNSVVFEKKVTLSNGERITLKPKSESYKLKEKKVIDDLPWNINNGEEFQLVDMNKLYENLRIEEASNLQMKRYHEEKKQLQENELDLEKLINKTSSNKKKKKKINSLWTEKYRPRKFIDLIGNERVNANILKWLSEWNYAINVGKLINSQDRSIYLDPLNRPRKKIILIHGPPGIGKTTIAQCVCKQLGYELNEINSSDERSGVIVKDKIKNCLKMRSLSGKNVCLVLDEIDGAVGNENGFIKILVNLINRDIKACEEWNTYHKLKYHKNEDFLKRPIIALCNDINAHCLDQLKPYCEVIQFKKSNNKNIKKRLKAILETEKVTNFNESLLDDLIVSLDGDIRNCINFLQFNAKSLNGKLKDSEIIWFQLLKEIFNLENKNIKNTKSRSEIFMELSNKLNNCSNDLNKINNGCFNLMLQVNSDDDMTTLSKLDDISDWLYFNDRINKNYTLFGKDDIKAYNSITPLKFFSSFANFGDTYYEKNHKFIFKSQENYELKRQVNDVLNRLNFDYSFKINKKELATNEIFMLNNILIPLNLNLKQFEIDTNKFNHSISILKDLNIKIETAHIKNREKFRTTYNDITKFNPNITIGLMNPQLKVDSMINSQNFNNSYRKNGADDDNDDKENIGYRLNEAKAIPFIKLLGERLKNQANSIKSKRARSEEDLNEGEIDQQMVTKIGENKRQQTSENKAVSTVDFFKQYAEFKNQLQEKGSDFTEKDTTKKSENTETELVGVMRENKNRIWVKYNEGFSNAVRKELTWDQLFN